ncbi:MAG: ABC transporter substrate-binding protein [Acidimicrobiales bacterium]
MNRRSMFVLAAVVCLGAGCATASSAGGHTGSSTTGPSGTLKIALDEEITSWDPAQASTIDTVLTDYFTVYDPLIQSTSTGQLEPGLATSWKLTPTSLDLTLRSNVKFTDGTPFNAAAVKANIIHTQKTGLPNNAVAFANVSSVDVVSPTEVRLNLSKPTPELLQDLTRWVGLMVSPKALANEASLKTDPVGTGGWILNSAQTNPGTEWVFDANPNYWDKSAQKVQQVDIYYLPDPQAQETALVSGRVDWEDTALQYAQTLKSSGYQVNLQQAFPYVLVILDRDGEKVPALKNPKVREAMSLAMNRSTFYKVTQFGYGNPDQPFAYSGQDAVASLSGTNLMAYSLSKAKTLMAEAGNPKFSLEFPSIPPFQSYDEAIAGFLAQIGIKVTLTSTPSSNVTGAAASGAYAAVPLPIHTLNPQEFYEDWIATDGPDNPFHDASPDVESVMSGVSGTNSSSDIALYKEMSTLVLKDYLVIPMGVNSCIGVWKTGELTGAPQATVFDSCQALKPLGVGVAQ